MVKSFKTAVLAAALAGLLFAAGASGQEAIAAAPALTKQQWREDLKYFAAELQKRHKNLFHAVSREKFESAVAALDAAVPTLEDHQIVVRMVQIAAMVGDGHTRVHLPASFRFYPMSLYWFGSEIRVLATDKEHDRALGARVVKIGELGTDDALARIRTCFPSAENENEWFVMSSAPAYIIRPEILNGLGIIPDMGKAAFTFENDDGKRFSMQFAPILAIVDKNNVTMPGLVPASTAQPLSRQKPTEAFWYTYLPESQTVYVNWRRYESLGENARKLFEFIDANKAKRLVIDLRQNGGGDFFQGRKHIVMPLKARADLNRKENLYVIVGRRTFSAAMTNAIDFRKETNATLVGEPIGERPNSYGENNEFTLPNSRIVVSYSSKYYKFLDQDVPASMPDKRIDLTWPDFKAGRDPVMDWILSQKP